jgi:hypothetical protein
LTGSVWRGSRRIRFHISSGGLFVIPGRCEASSPESIPLGIHAAPWFPGSRQGAPQNDGVSPPTCTSTPARRIASELLPNVVPPDIRGRRECRAPVAPAALRAKIKSTQASHHGHTGDIRHSPRNGFNGLFHALPGDRACCHRHQRDAKSIVANLTPASRRQDHVASPSASCAFVSCACRVHRIFRPTFVTIAKRPSCGRKTRGNLPVICPSSQLKRSAAHWHDGQIR